MSRKVDVNDRADLKTSVLLCADLENLGYGLDLKEVQKWLQETVPAVRVHFAPDLDHQPGELFRAVGANGIDRLILGLCSGNYAVPEVQAQAKKAGLDPLGVEIVNLGTYATLIHPRPQATEKAKVLLAAAVARARAFPGSRPENAKPYLPAEVSRRALVTLSMLEYRPVPSIHGDRCASGSGCELCVQVCPCGALEGAESQVRIDKSRCEGCGICLTTCPREAIEFPGYAPAQLTAQITTLLDPTVGTLQHRGILLTCHRSAPVLERLATRRFPVPRSEPEVSNSDVEFLPVQVPCLGMVPPTWALGCLTLGAAAVWLIPCAGRCPLAQKEVIEGRAAYCRELLRLLGGSPERIRLLQPPDEGIRRFPFEADVEGELPNLDNGTWSPSSAQVLLQLVQNDQAPERLILIHPHSPVGVIEVTDDCTSCGMCVAACPTGALAPDRRDDELSLTFDAALCTACGQCLSKCPEAENQVLRLQRITDFQRLLQGRVTIYQDRDLRCEACGATIAPEAMLRRMEALLGNENALTLSVITRYCPDCRGWLG